MEPSPRAIKFVSSILLPKYGWRHELAGTRYPENEMSFRQTLQGRTRTDRGFQVVVDRTNGKALISFDAGQVSSRHTEWLNTVKQRVGLAELSPQPYWGFDDLFHKAGTKLLNCFYVQAETKKENGQEYFNYTRIHILQKFEPAATARCPGKRQCVGGFRRTYWTQPRHQIQVAPRVPTGSVRRDHGGVLTRLPAMCPRGTVPRLATFRVRGWRWAWGWA
jgi:hypothetical protein